MKGPVFAQPFRPRMIMTKMTARITSRRTIAMRTATMGNSLIGLLVAKSVVVAANCFSAGCNRKRNKVSCGVFWIPLPKGLGYGHHRQPICGNLNMQANFETQKYLYRAPFFWLHTQANFEPCKWKLHYPTNTIGITSTIHVYLFGYWLLRTDHLFLASMEPK